ncbi:hypothetical protein D1823_01485 [Ruegeria sp. AD91A]|nr:hypothetical protein D1823_01485 [Ruegeria sp. AD91A]
MDFLPVLFVLPTPARFIPPVSLSDDNTMSQHAQIQSEKESDQFVTAQFSSRKPLMFPHRHRKGPCPTRHYP